jgi:rubrerythrin
MIPEDIGTHLHYDEQVAIETYVLRNFAHLLTETERAELDGGLARWWEENLERMHEWGARARASTVAPPWEPATFDEAHAAQVRAIVRRLRADHPDLVILRCARCGRIGRGPDDPRCPWCRATSAIAE